jgi:antitoxin HicB
MYRARTKKGRFHIRFEEAEEGGYVISIPEMPGCVTQAEDFAEGLEMVQDALEGLLEVRAEYGDPIPEVFQPLADELTAKTRGRKTARSSAR